MTPEGQVKLRIRTLLKRFGAQVYFFMPVPSGYGERTLDFLGCANGQAFAIEAKRPGKAPTPYQAVTIRRMRGSNMKVFVIRSTVDPTLEELEQWLRLCCQPSPKSFHSPPTTDELSTIPEAGE